MTNTTTTNYLAAKIARYASDVQYNLNVLTLTTDDDQRATIAQEIAHSGEMVQKLTKELRNLVFNYDLDLEVIELITDDLFDDDDHDEIEFEDDVDQDRYVEQKKTCNPAYDLFFACTGKKAIFRGRVTKIYRDWAEKVQKITI